MTNENVRPDALAASIESVEHADKSVEVVVRMSNTATRALYYIADVRATRYDPATRILTLALSDEGRQVIPGAISKLPVFRHIDPGSEAEIRLRVPDRVIKLSRSGPPDKPAFEKYMLSDMDEVVVEIGWSDVPFYKDTRPRAKGDMRLPAARWEQHKARTSMRLRRDGPKSS